MDGRTLPPIVLPGLGKRGARASLPTILETLKVGMYTARNVPSAPKGQAPPARGSCQADGTRS